MAGPIMIMAGGTGGHVFPGLAVAEVLLEQQHDVVWLGTRQGLESRVIPEHGIEIQWISISGIRRRGILAWLVAPFKIVVAIVQVLATLYRCRPTAVLGMGGFVSGPGGIATWLARKPLLIHEQNAVAGTTNRLLSRFARRVFEAFPGSFPDRAKAACIGNPVRRSIAALPPPRKRSIAAANRRLRLLILGGSQGAQSLNRVVPKAIAQLALADLPEVWHQTGNDIEQTRADYFEAGLDAKLEPFIEDVATAYAWTDLVVARAGALTVAELAACGVGAVFVPYPYAADDHQTENALHFVAAGAAVLIPEHEMTASRLAAELDVLLADRAKLMDMAEQARVQAKPDAARDLACACVEFAGAQS